jgi:hypothetical protein
VKLKFYHFTLILVFLFPIDFRFFAGQAGLISFTTTEFFAYLLVFLAFISGFLSQQVIRVYKLNRYLFWYFVWLSASSIAGGLVFNNFNSLQALKDIFPAFIIFFFVVSCITNESRLKKIFIAYLLGIFVNAVIGLMQIFYDQPRVVNLAAAVNYKLDFLGQITKVVTTGFFTHPNVYSLLLLPAILLVINFIYTQKNLLKKLTLFSFLVLLLVNLWFTQAKVTLTLALVGLFLLSFYHFKIKLQWFTVLSIVILAVILIVGFSLWLLANQNYLPSRNMLTRIKLGQAAFALFSKEPFVLFFGNGSDKLLELTASFWPYKSAHNFFLDQVVFFGLPALLFFFLAVLQIMLSVSKASYRVFKKIDKFLIVSLAVFLASYFFEPANIGVAIQASLFFIIGVGVVLKQISILDNKSSEAFK